jgi:hypothetical protein
MPIQEFLASGGAVNNSFRVPANSYVRSVTVNGNGVSFVHQPAGTVSLVVPPVARDVVVVDYNFAPANDKRRGQIVFGADMVPNGTLAAPNAGVGTGANNLSQGWEIRNGDLCYRVTATGIAATQNHIDLTVPVFGPITGDAATLEFYIDNPASIFATSLLVGTAGFAQFMQAQRNIVAYNDTDSRNNQGLNSVYHNRAAWTKNGYTGEHTDQGWTVARVRVFVNNGTTGTFWLRSIRVSGSRPRGRLAIFADDGVRSFFRVGMPIIERFGFPVTASIIGSLVDSTSGTGYVTLNELYKFVDNGNVCVTHGASRLFGGPFTTDAARLADVRANRDYLVERGLTPFAASRCYVWPNGVYNSGDGNVNFLELMRREGFVIGRAAGPLATLFDTQAVSALNHSLMVCPIVGHTYQGVAGAAGDATETTNINNIITRIQAAAANGSDACLMLHEVVPRGATTATGSVEIEADRLLTILQAIQVEVAAGRLEVVTFDRMIAP